MNIKSLTSLLLISSVAAVAAGEADQAQRQFQIFAKNVARQHVGSNLFLFNSTSQKFQPTEAAAAWLDDDVTTGWPVMSGQQHYLLTLAEPTLLTNIALSTRPTNGTVTVYVGDEPAAPGAKSWTAVVKGIPVNSINDKKLTQPFSRFAKYVLIETDIADPGSLFSLYVYGDHPAVSYQLRKRETPIDTRAIFGPYVNNSQTFSIAALYAHSTVSYAASSGSPLSWQRAIDENPESGVSILPTTDEAGLVLNLASGHQVSRLAVLTGGSPAKGKIEFFVVPSAPAETTSAAPATGSEVAQVSNETAAPAPKSASLAGLTPTITLVLDGSENRGVIAFPGVEGNAVLLRWTPDTAGEALDLRELNAFNEVSLNDYELSLTPEAVAELRDTDRGGYADASKDSSKDAGDYKDGKSIPPVGEFLSPRTPYLPGGLGFPPNLTRRKLAPAPVSP